MPLIAKEGSTGSKFPPTPQGLHLAVSYGVFDLGTHYEEKWDKEVHKIVIIWEIPEERVEIEKDGEKLNLPRAISKQYTLSLHQKANLRKDLESWRGKGFTKEELRGFDIFSILGITCQLNVIHTENNEKTYANVSSVVPAPKGIKLESENNIASFSFIDLPGKQIPDNTPEWIKDLITSSSEWLNWGKEPEPLVDNELPPIGAYSDDLPF